ncbi:MAG: ubiquinol-cytochrome C chaperone family protein [Nitratireductor sp.]
MFGKIFSSLFGRKSPIPQQLYGSVVAQWRNPVFFTDFSFEDTVTGRFDLLTLHVFLLSRRLVREDDALSTSLNQEIFDLYTQDIDIALRNLGVGDPSVPKRKKKMVRGFYAIVEEFAHAMDDENEKELAKAIKDRFYKDVKKSPHVKLSKYIIKAAAKLDAQPSSEIYKGELAWQDPADFV